MGSRTSQVQQEFADILVTGATGRIGALLRRSWPAGCAVWQARNRRNGFVTFDPMDPGAHVRAAPSAGGILCLAGVVPARAGTGANSDDYRANTDLALAAVRAGAETGAHVFLASSAAVYGPGAAMLHEASALAPASPYGAAKARMEEEATVLGDKLGVPVTALRIGNIAGLDAILGGWLPGFRLDRFDDETTPRRSYIGVHTLTDVLWEVVQRCPRGALNIAQPGPVAMGDLLDAAGLPWRPRPATEATIARVELATARLQSVLDAPLPAATPEALVDQWRQYRQERPA